jgi:hypothetical protein
MIMRISTRTSARKPGASNQIRDLNLLRSNALVAARAHILGPTLFAVIRDVLCNYCIPPEQLAVRMVTRPSFS